MRRLNSGNAAGADSDAVDKDLVRDTVRIYERNIGLIQSLADTYGFSCQFFWQPVVFTKRHVTEFESGKAKDMDEFRDFCLAVYRQIESSNILNENKRYRNISSVFDDVADECYLDFAHLNEGANEVIAKEMLVHVTPTITEPPTAGMDLPMSDWGNVTAKLPSSELR